MSGCGKSNRHKKVGCNTSAKERMLVVQFFHSGIEFPIRLMGNKKNAVIRGDGRIDVAWNRDSAHYRRLLRNEGWYVDVNGEYKKGLLNFWNEWEAETTAEQIGDGTNFNYAQFVHEIKLPGAFCGCTKEVISRGGCGGAPQCSGVQNTDPCVFGETFKYSNCLQTKFPGLQTLSPCSLIVFGSSKKKMDCGSKYVGGEEPSNKFYLDTVFVVSDTKMQYSSDTISRISCSKEYRNLTLRHVAKGECFTFYRGAIYDDASSSSAAMYSFTPAKICDGTRDSSKRCVLDVELLNKESGGEFFKSMKTQGAKYTHVKEVQDAKKVWDAIVKQVYKQGFVLGVKFDYQRKNARSNPTGFIDMIKSMMCPTFARGLAVFSVTIEDGHVEKVKMSFARNSSWHVFLLALIGIMLAMLCGLMVVYPAKSLDLPDINEGQHSEIFHSRVFGLRYQMGNEK